ncbi:MAG: xanthine dehydrogenase accessory protein XdhC [Pseudomonadota bacterium]
MSAEALLAAGAPLILAEIETVEGSAPREPGAWLLVGAHAIAGTIGGGRLEWEVMARARALLQSTERQDVITFSLGPSLGQCCGGRVRVRLERLNDEGRAALCRRFAGAQARRPAVFVFGAGHTGMALARALAPLPLAVTLVDTRAALLESVPAGVEPLATAIPESAVRGAPAGSAFAIMTHDHGLDFLVTHEALDQGDAAYVGLIGSASKRARFEGERTRRGLGKAHALTCPIGAAGLGDKRPEVIALHTAGEIMTALSSVPDVRPDAGSKDPAYGEARREGMAWTR